MEVNLNPETQAKLARLAAARGREMQMLVQEAIERLVDHEEWFLREVEAGLASADRGELVDHNDLRNFINDRYLADSH